MPNDHANHGGHSNAGNHGGSHEQHVKAGQQSHKNSGSTAGDDTASNDKGAADASSASSSGTRGGSHEQHVKAGQQSHKNS